MLTCPECFLARDTATLLAVPRCRLTVLFGLGACSISPKFSDVVCSLLVVMVPLGAQNALMLTRLR